MALSLELALKIAKFPIRLSPEEIKRMTIAFACVLFMGLFPYVAAGIAKKGFENYDNSQPRTWLAQQSGFRARANAAQANLFESLPFFFAAVIIASLMHSHQTRLDLLALGFVASRIAYLICYVANWPTARSIVWLCGIACVVTIFFQI